VDHLHIIRKGHRYLTVVSYNQNLWIDHPFVSAAYLPR